MRARPLACAAAEWRLVGLLDKGLAEPLVLEYSSEY
jgi:hypothetical protein